MFKPMDQVAYIPSHAKGKAGHPDIEFGFVFSVRDESCFCRFWLKSQPGVLRTISCSELVNNADLVEYKSHSFVEAYFIYNKIVLNKLKEECYEKTKST